MQSTKTTGRPQGSPLHFKNVGVGLAPPGRAIPEQLKSGKASNKYTRFHTCQQQTHFYFQVSSSCQKKIDLGVASSSGEAARVPRKEVIQPHLPVRLPCYDFTPITNPTLDACLSSSKEQELAQRLQVLPTFVV